MKALGNRAKVGVLPSETPSRGLRTKALFGKMVRAAGRRWHDAQIRRTARDLERLDDRLLRDVGLFREHLPSGATHVRRL